jgi:hypothetical protein
MAATSVPVSQILIAASALYLSGKYLLSRTNQEMLAESPLVTAALSSTELDKLPYPPNFLPGARNIQTPFGSTHVFEFGPEDGQKVLLVHGISTPCISVAGVAKELVKKGCRVLLFGIYMSPLFGLELIACVRLVWSRILCYARD